MNSTYIKKSKILIVFILLLVFLKGYSQEDKNREKKPQSLVEYLSEFDEEAEKNEDFKQKANDVFATQEETAFQSSRNSMSQEYLSGLESEKGYLDLDKLQSQHHRSERIGNLKILGFFVLIGIFVLWLAFKVSRENEKNLDNKTSNIKENKISTIGYYSGNKSGFSEYTNQNYDIHYMLKFNPHGLAAFAESDEGPIVPNYEEFKLFNNEVSYKVFSSVTKYNREGDNISIKFYEPEDGLAYEQRIINERIYTEWVGKIVNEKTLLLSCKKAFYSHALQEYTIDYSFKNLLFHLKH